MSILLHLGAEKAFGGFRSPTGFRTAKKLNFVMKVVLGEKQYFLTWEHFKYVNNEGKHCLEAIES